ncbi:hypothetical protein HNQ94_001764 [Salirhabdus euzebyi]|uniref:Putative Flp pilus-assembly TadG-like N-terminal domain-containing protein n=1 Tax=Salirhabdus euzebyi TaxID=394506 RepID=A0A841Q4I0_9BACI|nr:Tad domain-containing protein [Salirhabdus euzebyi]MBB6453316.1 hypothetical protein [Salirhabdus euzebyi]
MQKFFSNEKGQSIVLVVIMLVVLVGLAGLVIDGGRLYLAKSQLQKAVDAGALAGADMMVEGMTTNNTYNYSGSKDKAEKLAHTNYTNSKISYLATFPDESNVIKVDGEEKVSLLLMSILGLDLSTVKAEAQAKIGQLNRVGEGLVVPIGIELNQELTYGSTWELNDQPGSGVNGWYNFLDFSHIDPTPPNSGNSALADYIIEGSPSPIEIGDTLHVQEGEGSVSNNVQKAVEFREGQIVYVPVVEPIDDENKLVKVIGFAAFKITGEYSGHAIEGEFIQLVTPGEIGDNTSEYGTYTSKLIK